MYSISGWTSMQPQKPSLWKRLTTNRYHPGGRWISVGDIHRNVLETLYCFMRRVPPGSLLHHDQKGRIVGYTSLRPW